MATPALTPSDEAFLVECQRVFNARVLEGAASVREGQALRRLSYDDPDYIREDVMVKFVRGKRGLLVEGDVPQESWAFDMQHQRVPATIENTRAQLEKLRHRGEQIEAGAGALLRLWKAGADETGDLFVAGSPGQDKWFKYDKGLTDLVCRTWLDWTLAAGLFRQLSEEDQGALTREYGFLGNEGAGYHAMARLFLDSPALKEVRSLREEMRRRRYAERRNWDERD